MINGHPGRAPRGISPDYYRDDPWQDDYRGSGYGSDGQDDFRATPVRGTPVRGAPPTQGSRRPSEGSEGGEGPAFLLEHLATFRVSEEAELVEPGDGMRRLLHMEKTTGIWTQRMLLRLDRRYVSILSHENEVVVERFPLSLVRNPTAFTSEDPKEIYDNIFIFVADRDPSGAFTENTEMHIFQCMEDSAKAVVEDMKSVLAGKWPLRRASIPPPPLERAPAPPSRSRRDYGSPAGSPGRPRPPRSDRSSEAAAPDDASSEASENFSKDVAVLNCCFDDIERFIARLQHTASATRELERRVHRKYNKKHAGDGLLSMRAKPPAEREFHEILQKFKLSFNMLGKLRSFIHEPNAPELVHFIFSPLGLIVDASIDSNYGMDFPSKVVSPLLTKDAIDLLTNCMTSAETELWQSLGEAWRVPRRLWGGAVPPYQPVFSSGWKPDVSDDARGEPQGGEDLDEFYDREPRREQPYRRGGYSESDVSGSESGGERGGAWLASLRERGARIVTVTYPRTANNDRELTVVRGELLEVLDDSRRWWRCGNARGQTAHVPHTIVTPYTPYQDMPPAPPADRRKHKGKHRYM